MQSRPIGAKHRFCLWMAACREKYFENHVRAYQREGGMAKGLRARRRLFMDRKMESFAVPIGRSFIAAANSCFFADFLGG